MREGRLIIEELPLSGQKNMEIDRGLLEAAEERSAPIVLRLYRWKRPTVTIGRFQDEREVDAEYCAQKNIDIVRRPTGGGGVLHDDELTYAIIARSDHGVPRGTEASYALIARGLLRAFEFLGVSSPSIGSRAALPRRGGNCYAQSSPADLAVGVAKLCGSAQVWSRDAVLQHGSFVRSRDVVKQAHIFRMTEEQEERLRTDATALDELLGSSPPFEAIVQAVVQGFSETFDLDFNVIKE